MSGVRASRGVQYREHRIEGLKVLEVVVGRADFEARLPVLLQLHGRGDRARLPVGGHEAARPLRIVIPQAPKRAGLGFTWAPVSITANRPRVLGEALVREAERLARVLRHIESMREVEGRPIATGFSQGAMLAYTLAVRHPASIGAALPISGWIPPHIIPSEPPVGARAVPIVALHGAADDIVRIGPTRLAVERLRELGYDVQFEEFPGVGHEISAEMRRRHRELLERALRRVAVHEASSA